MLFGFHLIWVGIALGHGSRAKRTARTLASVLISRQQQSREWFPQALGRELWSHSSTRAFCHPNPFHRQMPALTSMAHTTANQPLWSCPHWSVMPGLFILYFIFFPLRVVLLPGGSMRPAGEGGPCAVVHCPANEADAPTRSWPLHSAWNHSKARW